MVWEAGLPGISRSNPTLQAGVRIESQPVQAQQPAQYYMPPQPVQYQPQPMQFQPPQQPYTSIGLGGGGTQGQNALPLWGLAQGGNTQSGWQIGGSTGGGQLYGTYLLGGGGSTDTYIEPWMPQERAALIQRTGMSPIGMEVQSLKKQIDAEKNNYARQALTAQYNNAMIRWQKEWENQIPAYRNLALSGLRQQAERAVADNTAIGEPTNLNAMWGNSVLSNNNVQIGIIQQGRMIAPRGNALEDALAAGLDPRSSLAQFLADQDVFAQDDYMPGAKPSLMSGYNSMGLGGGTYTGNADAFAYGGDGRQYAKQESWDIIRDYNWANDAQKAYDASMANRNPLGSYQGPTTSVSGKIVQNYGAVPPSNDRLPEPTMMSRNAIIDEIYQHSGSIGDIPSRFADFDKPTLEGILRVVRGNSSAADQAKVNMPGLQPQEDWYTPPGYPTDVPYTGLQSPPTKPGQYETWVPPANMDPDKMYGPPKTSMTLPLLETLFGIADAPEITTSSKPLPGTLSPEYTSYDSFDGPLFTNDSRFNTAQPYSNAFTKEYGLQAGAPSNQFDRYAVDPFTAGQNAALLQPRNAMQLIRMWSNVNY